MEYIYHSDFDSHVFNFNHPKLMDHLFNSKISKINCKILLLWSFIFHLTNTLVIIPATILDELNHKKPLPCTLRILANFVFWGTTQGTMTTYSVVMIISYRILKGRININDKRQIRKMRINYSVLIWVSAIVAGIVRVFKPNLKLLTFTIVICILIVSFIHFLILRMLRLQVRNEEVTNDFVSRTNAMVGSATFWFTVTFYNIMHERVKKVFAWLFDPLVPGV